MLSETEVQVKEWRTEGGLMLTEGCHVRSTPTRYGAGDDPGGFGGHPNDIVRAMQRAYLVVTSGDRHLKRHGAAVEDLTVTSTAIHGDPWTALSTRASRGTLERRRHSLH
jgi:hypothetical protein